MQLLILGQVALEVMGLKRTPASEVFRIEIEDDPFPPKFREARDFSFISCQLKTGSGGFRRPELRLANSKASRIRKKLLIV